MSNLSDIIHLVLQETIEHTGNKYCLVADSGRNLGCYRSRSGAVEREKQVNFFKHKKKKKKIKKEDVGAMSTGSIAIGGVQPERDKNE